MRTLFTLFLLLGLASATQAQTSRIWDPSKIHWQQQDPDGSKYAVLEGDRAHPGNFTYAFFLPDGVWIQPHWHTRDARVFVVSGMLLLGDGDILDKSRAHAIPAGGFFLVPRRQRHWEGAKGDTLIIGVGSGPWKTTNLK